MKAFSMEAGTAARHGARLSWIVATASLALATTSACKDPPPSPPPAPQTPPKPVDHLGPGEMVESDAKAFGLLLPRGMVVTLRMTSQISGEVSAQPENVANFFRARVADGKITVGTTSTNFSHVRPKDDPQRLLDIRVEKAKTGTHVEILEVAPTPAGPPPANQAEALKRSGLSASGQPDPQMQ